MGAVLYFTIRLNKLEAMDMLSDTLSLTFGALADPTRRAMLARLSSGEASVNELAKPFKMSLPAVSKHLKVLEKSGLITRGRQAQWRPCRLEAKPMKEAVDWIETHRKEFEERFDRLDAYLQDLQKEEKTHRPKKGASHV
jgi:DNA-binding transcriptional ArsR family regulator